MSQSSRDGDIVLLKDLGYRVVGIVVVFRAVPESGKEWAAAVRAAGIFL